MTKFKSMSEEDFTFLYENLPVKKLARALGYHDKNGKFHQFSIRSIQKRRVECNLKMKEHKGRYGQTCFWKDEKSNDNETYGKIRSILERVRKDEYQENAGNVMEYLADKASFKFQK